MEKIKNIENEFYNTQKMLSYNQYFNMVIGGRGIGKTFAIKKFLLSEFLKHKKQFIYLRRNKTELDRIDKDKFFTKELLKQVFKDFEVIDSIFNDINSYIKFKCSNYKNNKDDIEEQYIHELKISSGKVILNNEIVCYMKSLSTWVDLKGSEYDEVFYIMFDEVLIDTTSKKSYLKNEVEALFNFMFSVFRKRLNCKIFLLSNASNMNNPYFNYFKFNGDNKKRFHNLKKFKTLIEFPPNKPFKNNDDNPFYSLISESDIKKSLVNNDFQINGNNNICKIKQNKILMYSIGVDKEKILTLWSVSNIIYVSSGYDKNTNIYTFNIENVENGFLFQPRSSGVAKVIRNYFYNNLIYYENLDIKFLFTNAIKNII